MDLGSKDTRGLVGFSIRRNSNEMKFRNFVLLVGVLCITKLTF